LDRPIVNCPGCHHTVALTPFCQICGFRLQSMSCQTCGQFAEAGSRFCAVCGASLNPGPVQPSSVAPVAPPPAPTSSPPILQMPWFSQDPTVGYLSPYAYGHGGFGPPSTPPPGSSVFGAIGKTILVLVGFAIALLVLLFAVGNMVEQRPQGDPLPGGLFWLVVAVVGICLWVVILVKSGWRWAVAAFFLFLAVFPYWVYHRFRQPKGKGGAAKPAVAAMLAIVAAGIVMIVGTELANDHGNRTYRVEAGDYPTLTPGPTRTPQPTSTVRPTRTPQPTTTGSATEFPQATDTKLPTPVDGTSYDISIAAEQLLNQRITKEDNPGRHPCEVDSEGDEPDGSLSVYEMCDWGMISYFVVNSDSEAYYMVRDIQPGPIHRLEQYPQYTAAVWADDDYAYVVVAVGNVVISGYTDSDWLTSSENAGAPRDTTDRAETIATLGVARLLRLLGEPAPESLTIGTY